jgi:hypothetical protein
MKGFQMVMPNSIRKERGAALIGVILALLVITILGIGITLLGMVNLTVGNNERQGSEAFYLADAGITHAERLFRARASGNLDLILRSGNNNACDGDELAAVPPPPLVAADAIPSPANGGQPFGAAGRYEVRVCDDDATEALPGPGLPEIPLDPNADKNDRVRLVSTGFGRDNSTATIEMLISAVPLPAVLVDGNLRINGNPRVVGAAGSIHSNQNLQISGTPSAEQYVSSSGTLTGGNAVNTGAPPAFADNPPDARPGQDQILVPDFNPIDYRPQVGDQRCNPAAPAVPPNLPCYELRNNGQTINLFTGAFVPRPPGWVYLGAAPGNSVQYDITGALTPASYYIEGNVKIGANPGSAAAPVRVSLLVEGSLEMGGNPSLQPTGALSVPGGAAIAIMARDDLKLNGNPGTALNGLYYAGDQIQIGGNGNINGQVIVKNRDDNPSPPGFNLVVRLAGNFMEISGNPNINYDGLGGLTTVTMNSWRECRLDPMPGDNEPCNF